jgi:cell division protein FtsN
MDQDSTKGTDKRNWRERLGIGTGSATGASKELPKISDTYSPAPAAETRATPAPRAPVAPRAPAAAKPAVKPAPMAPRATPRAPAAAEPEKLAEKLRSQREASAKLAEQRVQVARQRAEATITPTPPAAKTNGQTAHTNGASVPKPKFTFAEDEGAAPAARPVVQQPIAPARPPLGATPTPQAYAPQRPPVAPPPPNPYLSSQSPLQQRPLAPPPYQQQPMPGYRPVDPATGYAPIPQSPFPPQRPAFPQGYGQQPIGGPRLNVPQRGPVAPGYPPPPMPADYGAQAPLPPDPRSGRLNRPGFTPRSAPQQPRLESEDDTEQYFEEAPPPPRGQRRGAADYQQAYREMETGYDDEPQRSSGPWILLGLLLLALAIAGASVWYYQSSIKPMMTGGQGSQTEQAPVVAAPSDPAKVEPPAAQEPAQGATSKKRIYDRIVGDQEVLGGEIQPSEEAPLNPNVNASESEPAPIGNGDDAQPLPIPPPPGDGNTQGSLEAEDPAKQSAELETPAAGASQAAVAAPAPGEFIEPATASAVAEEEPVQQATPSETITDEEPVVATPAKPKVAAKPKKAEPKKTAEKALGAKPVVLVPAKKKPTAKVAAAEEPEVVASVEAVEGSSDDLYGADADTTSVAQATPQKPAATKKKRTLADFLTGGEEAQAPEQANLTQEPEAAPAPAKKAQAAAKPTPKPAPETQVAAAGGYVAQLASFRSRDEANAEFGRLKSKYASVLRGASPVVSQAEVAGTTRYRLSVGGMASRDEATALCNKLFAAGERDCLVRRQ